MKASELTEEQRQDFANLFYSDCETPTDIDSDNPSPWGCPWYWGGDLEGETIHEMVENFIKAHKSEWESLRAEEELYDEI